MPDQLTVPAIGKVKTEYVMLGGGLVVGLVGYAWWKRRRQADQAPAVVDPNLIPDTTRTPVVGDSTATVDTTGGAGIKDNADWTRKATDYLITLGFDAIFASTALGKWLAHKPLTDKEVEVVNAGRAAFGDPPTGGPFPVTAALPTADVPAPVAGLHVVDKTSTSIHIAWDASPGATSYKLTASSSLGPSSRVPVITGTDYNWSPLTPGKAVTLTVTAQNDKGSSAAQTITATT